MYNLNEKLLAETQKEIGEGSNLDPKSQEKLRAKFGDKFERAIKVLEDNHVKKYIFKPSKREIWIVVGRIRDYQVIPRLYCMCDDFYLNVVIRRTDPLCYHILAQMLADATRKFDEVEEHDEKYELLMREWASQTDAQHT